jgi:hypothetical protein
VRTIHCIGDSHVSVFSGVDKVSNGLPNPRDSFLPFRSYRLGSRLAYSIGCHGHPARRELFNLIHKLPPEDPVLLSYGEIDCRAHVVRQSIRRNIPIEQVVQDIVMKYFSAAKKIAEMNRPVFIFCPVSTSNIKDESESVRRYPFIGDPVDRNRAVLLFTEHAKNEIFSGCTIISVARKILSERFRSKEEYFFDNIHLSQKALPMILEEFPKKFIFDS